MIPELMATGLPVIASDHCDIPTVVNETNGFVCREKNIGDIEKAILKIMESGVLNELSKGARKTAMEKFDQAKLSAELEEFIKTNFK